MSHYFGAAVVPAGTTRAEVEKHLPDLLDPHEEHYDEATDTWIGEWDWWQVGGRWTGVWGEYDPERDPANIETCIHCAGFGRRPDAARFEAESPGWAEANGGCNGCRGTGRALKWPTGWRPHDGDVITVAALLNNPPLLRPHTLFLPDGTAAHRKRWDDATGDFVTDSDWDGTVAALLEPYRAESIVVVDFHN